MDNGTPFASIALGGLSQLSVWWIEQGIRVEFIRPGSPQENGSHERMHRDLKAEAARPASSNMVAQQKRFDRWRHEYNHDRPHEALDMLRPAEIYHPSARRLGEKDKIRYPKGYQGGQQGSDVENRIHSAAKGEELSLGSKSGAHSTSFQ